MALSADTSPQSSNPTTFPYKKPEGLAHSLDFNHDYFIIVEKSDNSKTELKVRASFVNQLAGKPQNHTEQSTSPIMCVLIEGGTRAIKAFSSSLDAKIPCIIISGTGRAADFLAKAKAIYDRDSNLQPEKMINLLSGFLETKVEETKSEETKVEETKAEEKKREEKKKKENKEITETFFQFANALKCLKEKEEKLENYMRVCQIDNVELDKHILELLYLQKKNHANRLKPALDLSFSWDRAETFGKIIRQDRQVHF